MLKNQETYEIMRPETVGLTSNMLVLGKHSGKHAYRSRLAELGYTELTDEQIETFVDRFKRLADEKKEVTDADMEAIVNDEIYKPDPVWNLVSLHVTAGNLLNPTATVSMEDKHGKKVNVAEIGSGPIDAVFKCIKKIVETPTSLIEYSVNSVTQGTTAVGSVTVRIKPGERNEEKVNPQTGGVRDKLYSGSGSATDIIVASAEAYVNAFNKMMQAQEISEHRELQRTQSSQTLSK